MGVNEMEKYFYNGFRVDRPDGSRIYYTIQNRTYNSRPYALYINGDQCAWMNTYINRGALVNAVKRAAIEIKYRYPNCIISDICGAEIIK
jgi:hypothetical protein